MQLDNHTDFGPLVLGIFALGVIVLLRLCVSNHKIRKYTHTTDTVTDTHTYKYKSHEMDSFGALSATVGDTLLHIVLKLFLINWLYGA